MTSTIGTTTFLLPLKNGFLDPRVALLLELESQLLPARPDKPAIEEDMHGIRDNVIKEALVMSYHDDRAILRPEVIDPLRHGLQGIDVEPRVGLIEDRELGVEDGHLEDLVPLLLPSGEPFVDGTGHQALVHLENLHPLPDQGEEVHGIKLLEAAAFPNRVQARLQEIHVAHSRDLDRVLEREENSRASALLGSHLEQVSTLEEHLALGDLVGLAPGQYLGRR